MDKTNFALEIESRQEHFEKSLTAANRRLLLGASLQILRRRFEDGKAILQGDVARLTALADDVGEVAT